MLWVNNVCRLCGKISEICYNMFDDEDPTIREKVFKCLKLEICKEDFKPKQICDICYNKIDDFVQFTELCLEMDLKFESIYLAEASNEASNDHKPSVIVSNTQHPSDLQEAESYLTEFFDNANEASEQTSTFFASDSKDNKQLLISVQDVQQSITTTNCGTASKNKGKSFPCPHCEKTFKRKINLTAHISVHTNIRQFKCQNCPKTFAVKSLLTQHNKTHSELYQCPTCLKQFQVPSKLARHLHTHTANKPYECRFADCDKAFSDKHNLNQHVLSHSPEKSVPCEICRKLFKTKKNLNAHMKSHLDEKVYQCNCCEKKYRYKHNLKAHLVKHQK